ncbi:unnamed protein product [Linum trigynum]|uniref:Uncharacterized protein n=1 Tax=Linum trigynum TaxID=586398 RepID=A0AAV2ETG3_9ROSI
MEVYLDQLSITQRHLLRAIRNRTFAEHLDFEVFEAFHARPQMEAVVRPYGWRRFLTLAEPTYKELVWEFYATFHHNSKGNSDHADAVQFTLGGVAHSLSYWEFANALRLNSRESGGRPLHLDLSDPSDFASQAYFQRICLANHVDEEYVSSQTRASLLRPEWRILNHLLTQSYTPSKGSANRVTLRTLWLMHSMGLSEDTIQLGSVLARTFTKAAASQSRNLVCGPVITALARHYGVDYTGMTLVQGPTPLSEATLRHQHNGCSPRACALDRGPSSATSTCSGRPARVERCWWTPSTPSLCSS